MIVSTGFREHRGQPFGEGREPCQSRSSLATLAPLLRLIQNEDAEAVAALRSLHSGHDSCLEETKSLRNLISNWGLSRNSKLDNNGSSSKEAQT